MIKFSFGSVSKAIKSEVIEEEDRIKPESTDCGGNGDSNQARCSVDVKPFADLKPFNILKKGKTDGNDSDRKRKNPLSSKITGEILGIFYKIFGFFLLSCYYIKRKKLLLKWRNIVLHV